MFGYADGRCPCSEDLHTFCGRVCFPLSATIIIQYISEKACCSPHKQTDVQLAEFVRVAALYTWSKKKKNNNKNGCSAKVEKRPNTAFLSHQLSWSDPLVANLMQNKPSWWQFSADHLTYLDLSSDWLHFLSPLCSTVEKQMLLVDSSETERLRLRRLRRLRRLTGVWRAPPPWDEKQPWEEGGRLGRH